MPEIQMPKLSDTMTEGTIVTWRKKKGEKVSAGEVLAEIETDKATMEGESPEDGTLTQILVPEGGKVEVGKPLAFIGEPGEGEKKPEPETEEAKEKEQVEEEEIDLRAEEQEAKEEQGEPAVEEEPKAETEKPAPARAKEKETAPPQSESAAGRASARPQSPPPAPVQHKPEEPRIKASPVARRIAAELGVDLSVVKGTGPDGRVTESDVRAAAKRKPMEPARPRSGRDEGVAAAKSAQPRPPLHGEATRIQLSGMRRGIAERLLQSKGPVPHFYLNIEIDAGPLMEARAELKAAGEDSEEAKITVNDFVLKAAVMAALKVPKVNAAFEGESIVQYADVDLGIAVAIEDGLLTPVIRGAQNKSLREISALAKDMAARARSKRMKPEEFQGGSFTVSNLGGMGIDSFSAIINPPQGFILAIGAIRKVPVVDNCDQIIVGHRMSIWMSCDHRVIDGALGAQYLKELRHLLENPALLLV
jgi:pyruvate dehydrogenase E2 component (dihydrolipoamide acetyltransferase)